MFRCSIHQVRPFCCPVVEPVPKAILIAAEPDIRRISQLRLVEISQSESYLPPIYFLTFWYPYTFTSARNSIDDTKAHSMSQTEAIRTESLDGHDPDPDVQKKAKSRRPASEIDT